MTFTAIASIVVAILFVSTFIRSALGFGDALVAMPLLAMAVGVTTATPIVAFAASTIAITILLKDWREVDVRSTWRLVVSSLVGIPFGLVLLKFAPEFWVKIVLGVFLILYGIYNLLAPRLPTIENQRWSYLFGFVAGVLGGAYNANGPPVVIYGTLRRWPPEKFRATLQGCFVLTGLMIVAGHGIAELWTPLVLKLYLVALPAILVAVYLGEKLNRRIPREKFSRLVYVFLVVIGVLLFF